MNQVVPEYHRFRDQLVELFRSAIEAAQPGPAVLEALRLEPGGTQPFIIAIGKAAIPMARAALTVLEERGDPPDRRPGGHRRRSPRPRGRLGPGR
jgi:hypothetical protein